MKELKEFSFYIEDFLKNIQKISHRIFSIYEDVEKGSKEFKESLLNLEERMMEIEKFGEEFTFCINRIYENFNFLSENLLEFSLFVKEKYHEFIITINSLRKIETLGKELMEIFEDIFFSSRDVEIKAYHLGEEGKGLEVVAQELSKLTKKVKQKTEEFSFSLNKLRKHYISSEEISSKFIEEIEYITPKQKIFEELFEKIKENKKMFEEYYKNIVNFIESARVNFKNLTGFFSKFIELNEETINLGENAFNLFSLVGGIYETIEINENILKNLKDAEKRKFPREKINLLLKDFEQIIRGVKNYVGEIEKNLEKWRDLGENFEKYFFFKEESFKEEAKKLSEIFEEKFKESMDIVAKECYSILNSIKEMVKYIEYVENVENKTKEEIELLQKFALSFKNLIKDGDILSIYSMIESKRAGLEDESIARSLKDFVLKAEKCVKDIMEISYSIGERKDLKEIEINVPIILERAEDLNKDIKLIDEKFERIFEIINYLIGFEKTFYEWKEKIEKFIYEFYKSLRNMREEIEVAKEKMNEFFKAVEKERIFEKPQIPKGKKDVLRLILSSDPITLNPYLSEDAISNTIISKIHNTLFTLSPISTKILPLMVENFYVSEDGLKYKLKLKENIYFHNEKKLTSYEVYESFKKTLKGVYKNFFSMIQGAQDYIKGLRADIEGIKIINENEIEINLEYPFSPFLSNLTLSALSITIDEAGKIYGCGPYVLKEWVKGEKIVLERFNKYFYGVPYFDIVEYKIISSIISIKDVIDGKIHYLELSPSQIEELNTKFPEYKKYLEKIPSLSIHRIDFNNEMEPFNIKKVRKAICHLISPFEFVKEVLKGNGVPAKGVFPPGYEFYNPEIKGFEKDVEKAKKLLKEAGFENGFEFELCYSDREVYKRAAEFVEKNLKELDIKVIKKEFGWKELLERSKGEGVQSIIIGWGADTPDPDSFIFPLFHSSCRTHTRFKNKEIDELIEKARRERNILKRKEIYNMIEVKIIEEAPCVFLYHPLINALRNEKILGIYPHPIGSADILYAIEND
jgi:peptide/nickel transport system substrate-binding protein/oligopeptide transport system substrate-binding protein